MEELRALGVSLTEELVLARLQLQRALTWAAEAGRSVCDGKECPFGVVDSRLDLVSKLAERAKKVSDGILIRIVDKGAVGRIANVIQRYVTDPTALAAIREELEQVARGPAAGAIGPREVM